MSSKDSNFEPTFGWETELEEGPHTEDLNTKLIKLANKKLPLQNVLAHYKVSLEEFYNSSGWTFRGHCPFDDHNDKTPSFGFNPNSSAFNCFGCHRGGQSVDFIAYKEGKSKIQVAKSILNKLGGYSEEEYQEISNFDIKRFQTLLFTYSNEIRTFLQQHCSKKAWEYAKAVTWNLDVFLRNNLEKKSYQDINLDNLEARLQKLSSQLQLFGSE